MHWPNRARFRIGNGKGWIEGEESEEERERELAQAEPGVLSMSDSRFTDERTMKSCPIILDTCIWNDKYEPVRSC
jgi:hypothetical protein